jgi:hypothetical protein
MNYRNHPPRWLLALYAVAIAAAWLALSTSDYHEARKMECANRSTRSVLVEWDSSTDKCIKEKRNGTTAQNR